MPTITAYVHAYVPYHNAGAETTMHDILKYLVTRGWSANVIVKDTQKDLPDSWEVDGVSVFSERDKKTLISRIATSNVTISHLECSERLHILSNKWKIPTIHLVHNTHPLTRRWSASASGLIFNTEWIRDSETFNTHSQPSYVIHPPVNPEEYATERGKKITLVNLWEDKGALVFYELARRLPQLEFLGVKGGYGEQVIIDLPNVTILEHTPNMKSVYSQTKVILMPSKYESFGRVAVEAMASGIPTIAEPTPGLSESLGSAGIFADRETIDAWEKSLTELLKPAKYGKQSKLSLARSKELAEQRKLEIEVLPTFLNEVSRSKYGKTLC